MSSSQIIGFKPAVQLNIRINEDFNLNIVIKDKTTKLPIDITGFDFSGTIKKLITDTASFQDFSFDITDGINGKVTASIPETTLQSLVLPAATDPKPVFDMRFDEGTGGIIRVFLPGVVKFIVGITG